MIKRIKSIHAWYDAKRYKGTKVNGTRWHALPMIAVGGAAMSGMFALVSADVMAVNFTTADHTFQLYSNYVQGVSAGGFLAKNNGYSATSQVGVAEIGIKTAKLSGLCGIATESIGGVTGSLMIMAGVPVDPSFTNSTNVSADGAGNPITFDTQGLLTGTSDTNAISATDLFLASNLLQGYGNQISGLDLGQNANDVASTANLNNSTGTWPTGQAAPVPGNFGLSATHLNLGGLNGSSYGINLAGQITLPKLKIAVYPGSKSQSDCTANAPS